MPKNIARSCSRSSALPAAAVALLVGLVACNNDPFSFNWVDTPDTVRLYSLARPELNQPSAYSFYQSTVIDVEAPGATGAWDIAVDTREQSLVFLPPGALGISSRAAIATLPDMTLDDVTKAPSDTLLYESDNAVPIEQGSIYVVRTNRQPGNFGQTCVYYAKVEPVEIDAPNGTLLFRFVASPICNSLELVPPN